MKTTTMLNEITSSPEETFALGAKIANLVLENADMPRLIALCGDLGAGKTEFTRGFCSVAAPSSPVRSPTYAIVNEYRSGSVPVFHFDVYRITDPDDLYSVGFYDYLDRGICLVEWFDNISDCVDGKLLRVTIEKTSSPALRRVEICEVDTENN